MPQSQADEVLVCRAWPEIFRDRTNLRVPWQVGSVRCERIARYWRHLADVSFLANDRFAPLAVVPPNENHAAVATRVDGQWLILDNRTLTLVRDTDVTRAIPEFLLDPKGGKRFSVPSRNRAVGGR